MGKQITIIGLGNFGLDELPLGIYKLLKKSEKIYVRTMEHPIIKDLDEIEWVSFDSIYEKHNQFKEVYEEIVEILIEKAQNSDIVYAVPGDPMVAELTTQLLIKQYDNVKVLGGKSFLDDMFRAANIDPNDGFTLLDGTQLNEAMLNVRTHTIITQIYDQITASDIKITLMERYPDDHEVQIVTAARLGQANVIKCPLYEIDHYIKTSNLTSLFVPKVLDDKDMYGDFTLLEQTMDILVSEEGCPWDKAQTHKSLKRYLIEETFELIEAIDEEDIDHIVEELGDILLQVVLHSSIGKKEGYFDSKEVIAQLNDKMVRRHPHVFKDKKVENLEELHRVWDEEKSKEGKQKAQKLEKVFADYFMKLYDETKLKGLSEKELKIMINEGEIKL